MDALTDELQAQVAALPDATYQQRVIALFRSGTATPDQCLAMAAVVRELGDTGEAIVQAVMRLRATPDQWVAMATAVRAVSMGDRGILTACIDRAVLARTEEAEC